MTFLRTHYRLTRDLRPKDFEKFPQLSAVYGIRRLAIEDQMLVVEYDGSRIHEAQVLAAVLRTAIPVEPLKPLPPGSSDYSGEFKDFAWPTTGLSPVNQSQK